MLVVAVCLAAMQVALWLRGYHVCAHLESATPTSAHPGASGASNAGHWLALGLGLVLVISLSSCAAPASPPFPVPVPVPITMADAPVAAPISGLSADAADAADAAQAPAVGTLTVPLVRRIAWALLQFLANSSAVVEIKGTP